MKKKERRKEKRKERKRKKEKKTNIDAIILVNAAPLCNTFTKREHILVRYQKRHKVTYSILSWIPIFVKPFTFIKDMMSCINWIIFIQATKVFIRKETKIVFSYGSIINNSSCSSST